MHTEPQNIDKFTINDLSYCCKALIFTHPLVYELLCGLIFMGHPVVQMKHFQVSDPGNINFCHLSKNTFLEKMHLV